MTPRSRMDWWWWDRNLRFLLMFACLVMGLFFFGVYELSGGDIRDRLEGVAALLAGLALAALFIAYVQRPTKVGPPAKHLCRRSS